MLWKFLFLCVVKQQLINTLKLVWLVQMKTIKERKDACLSFTNSIAQVLLKETKMQFRILVAANLVEEYPLI